MPRHVVLVIEDEVTSRELIRGILIDEGFEVDVAGDAHEALEAFSARPADVVICDLFLPGSSGVDVIESIRKQSRQTKIIAISAGAGDPSLADANLSAANYVGANVMLRKPIDGHVLASTVRELLAG